MKMSALLAFVALLGCNSKSAVPVVEAGASLNGPHKFGAVGNYAVGLLPSSTIDGGVWTSNSAFPNGTWAVPTDGGGGPANLLYVATNGSDSNPCSYAAPCATYAHAAAVAVANGATESNYTTIVYAPGAYTENISFVSGTIILGDPSLLTIFFGTSFTLGTSFTGSALAGAGIVNVQFEFASGGTFDLNFTGLSSTNGYFSMFADSLPPTFSIEGNLSSVVAYDCVFPSTAAVTNAEFFSNSSQFIGTVTINATNSGGTSWESGFDQVSGSVLLEGTGFASVVNFFGDGFFGVLHISGTSSVFTGSIGSIPTGGVTYAGGATSAQYTIQGELPPSNVQPSTTNGYVLTTVGGASVWALPAGGGDAGIVEGGITQLTGQVTAGPGGGSQAATITAGSANGQIMVTTSVGSNSTSFCTVTGDIAYVAPSCEFFLEGIHGNALAAPSGTNTTILWNGSALSWAAAPASPVGAYTVVTKTTSFTAAVNTTYLVDTTGGAISVQLPATMTIGQWVNITDWKTNSGTNAITVTPTTSYQLMNPNTLLYGATNATQTININGESATWLSDGASRELIAP